MWTTEKGINTPAGVYVPKSDNLIYELVAAAKFAGLMGAFNVKIDGMYYESPDQLPVASIAALTKDVSVLAPETIEVEARDTAGC